MSKIKDINILVIGKSGIGKSTLINSLPLYRSFKTFKDAKDSVKKTPLKPLITTHFAYDTEDENGDYMTKEIKMAAADEHDENEHCEIAKSHTLKPKAYFIDDKDFRKAGFRIRIIDTPGICDTSGPHRDDTNMQAIIDYISELDHLNLIVFLLPPNQATLDTASEYAIKGLLMHFHQDAAPNIVFGFTNSYSCDFKAGLIAGALRIVLKEIHDQQGVDIHLNKKTSYGFDSEAFRYLCIKSQKEYCFFSKKQKKRNAECFETSRSEFNRLIEYAVKVKPHNPKFTAMLNYTRNLIPLLTGPLTMTATDVHETLKNIKDCEIELEKFQGKEKELDKSLYQMIAIVRKRLVLVNKVKCGNCAVWKCYYGDERNPYIETNPELANMDPLKFLEGPKAAKNENGEYYCPKCGPDFKPVKINQTYFTNVEEKWELRKSVIDELDTVKKSCHRLSDELTKTRNFYDTIFKERETIIKTQAKFAAFMSKYSIVPYNDKAINYLDILIKLKPEKAELYEDLKKKYEDEKRIIDESRKENSDDITPDEIDVLVKDLVKLEHYGNDILAALTVVNDSDGKVYEETTVSIQTKSLSFWQKLLKKVLNM